MKHINFFLVGILFLALNCSKKPSNNDNNQLNYAVDRFADIQVLRYYVPHFNELPLNKKLLIYHLSEAALAGRDIIYDQNYKHNLRIRQTLETIYTNYNGDQKSKNFGLFCEYLKQFWFSNGIHHHYGENKIIPKFDTAYLAELITQTESNDMPLLENETKSQFIQWLTPILFDASIDNKRVNKDQGVDPIQASAGNFYNGVTEAEVKQFYNSKKLPNDSTPISYGLNSQLVKENGKLIEKTWYADGMYGACIKTMVKHLENALPHCENEVQSKALQLLIEYYQTGNLTTWDKFNMAWVKDVKSTVDYIHGFIEVYHDPIGLRANYESCVQIDDFEASQRMSVVSSHAQWFEDNSPILPAHKKQKVTGITYRVVNIVMEAGDLAPSTAIGINLPNAEWIREKHGSKSVSLGNILEAYDKVNAGNLTAAFCYTTEEAERAQKYGSLAGKMHTALHEVIGHASGQMNAGITKDAMGQYGSTLEEARADLVALYYIMDKKMVDLKLIPSLDVGKTEYESYIRNGLMTQLQRINPGDNIEEDHMRNRQLVASWVYEKGKAQQVIEKKIKDNKTYFVVNNYDQLRNLFGQLLREIQRIKSTGDFEAGKKLVETYGVVVDKNLHKEVLQRVAKLNIAPYKGFVQPLLSLKMTGNEPSDVEISYRENFDEQMLRYSKNYSTLNWRLK